MRLHAMKFLLISQCLWGTMTVADTGQEQVPVGPRALALGGAYRAVATGPAAVFWNPAGLGLIRVSSLRGTTANLHGLNISDNVLTLVSPLGSTMGLGLEWYNSSYDDAVITDTLNRLNLGLGWRPWRRLAVGSSLKYRQYEQGFNGVNMGRGSGFGVDIGARFELHRQLQIAATVHDLGGASLKYEDGSDTKPYEANTGVGLAYHPWSALQLSADLDRDFHTGAQYALLDVLSLRAGWTHDLDGLEHSRLAAGFGVRYHQFQLDYAFQDHPALAATHHFGVAMDFTLAPRLVTISNVHINPLFASFYKAYVGDETGQIVLMSHADKPLEITLRVDQPNVMDQPTEKTVYLLPGVAQKVGFGLILSERITVASDSRPLPFNIEVEYQSAQRRRIEQRQIPTMVYASGYLNWGDGVARAAAFITPDDPTVADLARQIRLSSATWDREFLNNRQTTLAAAIWTGLSAIDMRYTPDPLNPFGEVQGKDFSVDSIQYPAEFLLSRTGDCDDSTVLLASLLENVGIATALVDVPGHIFLLFDTGISSRDQRYLGIAAKLLIPWHRTLWIPLETTKLGQPFTTAWQLGADLYHRFETSDRLQVSETLAARRLYPAAASAATVPENFRIVSLDSLPLRNTLTQVRNTLSQWQKETLRKLEQNLPATNTVTMVLAVARFHYRNQDFQPAHQELSAIAASVESAAVWNNLGAAQLGLGHLDEAVASFTTARRLAPQDPGVALNLGLALHLIGAPDQADQHLADAVREAAGVNNVMQLLGVRSNTRITGRADEKIAREQLTSAEIEHLLRGALARLPDVTLAVEDTMTTATADTTGLMIPSLTGGDLPDSTAIPADDDRRIATGTAGSRGSKLDPTSVVDLLYWKNTESTEP